ncbi:MAG: SBBP repeat-containing protein [Bacteroidetes bacterium]|nr:SBBP repeat-containing protein [Bacteroidota bacterium]
MRYLLFCLIFSIQGSFSFAGNNKPIPAEIKSKASQLLRSQPVEFLENKGQITDSEGKAAPFVLFQTDAPGVSMYITETGLTYIFQKPEEDENELAPRNEQTSEETKWTRIDMTIAGASIKKENVIKEISSETNYNFFNHLYPDGIYGVKKYKKITIKNIYPHIDWVLYGSNEKGFKYDFILFPGADPKQIELVYSSSKRLETGRAGNIKIETELGTLIEKAPVSYQNNKEIATRFLKTLDTRNEKGGFDSHIRFAIDGYNNSEILTIDPQLVWGTYYGGTNADGFLSIDTDSNNNIFITGYAGSATIPAVNPAGGAYYFGGANGMTGWPHLMILKFANNGALVWATYCGAHTTATYNIGTSVSIDVFNNLLITGFTESTLFPTQNPGGGAYFQGAYAGGGGDAFIMKFNNVGVRQWVTFYGGSGNEHGHFITSDAAGNIFVTGYTNSTNFPTLNPAGGTYFQGTNAGGTDAFIAKFSNSGVYQWGTYYGGSGEDYGNFISCDVAGNTFVTGHTKSTDLPTQNPGAGVYFQPANAGSSDAFILKFNNSGVRQWATYYGGSLDDYGCSGTISASGEIYIGGFTVSTNLPTLNPAGGAYFQAANAGGFQDAFILRFNNAGVLQWATYYGGSGDEQLCDFFTKTGQYELMDMDDCGNLYFVFETSSANIPTSNTGCANYFNNPGTNSYNFFGRKLGDVFLAQFKTNNLALVYATNLFPAAAGSESHREAICIDNNNNIYIVGERNTIPNGPLPALINPGGGAFNNLFKSNDDGFLLKLTASPPPTFSQSQLNATGCGNGNGSATITITCGHPDFNYTWSNGSQTLNSTDTSNTVTGLSPGNYTVTVTDGACVLIPKTFTYTISGGTGGSITGIVTNNNVNCNGGNDGSSTVAGSGGTAPYTYTWNNGQTTQTATGLSAGNYTVTVTDAGGCITSVTAIITEASPMLGQFTKGTANCSGCGCKQWVIVTGSGGTSPYSYSWSAPGGYANRYKNQLCPGTYIINIKDKNGCSVNINLTAP